MFTGIIQAVGTLEQLDGGKMWLTVPHGLAPNGFELGESLAVNGCCLTIVDQAAGENWRLSFDLSPETLNRTSFSCLRVGSPVNLERAMAADGRFGGHVVQGHVDTTATLASAREADNSWIYRFELSAEFDRYLIDKGSIAVEGISLTVVDPKDGEFDTWIIPHTLRETNLGSKRPGDLVNIEFDLIAKYVEKLMGSGASRAPGNNVFEGHDYDSNAR